MCSIESFDSNKFLWSDWITRLKRQLTVQKVKEEDKLAYLYSLMGSVPFGILRKTILSKKPLEVKFEEVNEAMRKHYEPESLEIIEVCKFQKMMQEDSETIAHFLSRLRRQATKCDYEDYQDNAIRNQLVLGMKEKKIQQTLYETDKLTLEMAIQLAEAMETVLKDKKEITSSKLNYIEKRNQTMRSVYDQAKSSKKKQCFRCGSTSHLANVCKF